MISPNTPNSTKSPPSPRFLPIPFDTAEDVERYTPGGFHPVHLGDTFDAYRIVHKLGAGGFATVWLARDDVEGGWVALKIVVADESARVGDKHRVVSAAAEGADGVVVQRREVWVEGPNGRHLGLVLPVLGPAVEELAGGMAARMEPWVARRVGEQATRALVELHERDVCHGGVTTANIVFTLSDFDQYTEDDIKRLFGEPVCEPLETENGEKPGPEAPKYIVKPLDFLSLEENIISTNVKLIDFDQSFLATSPPLTMLQTPVQFLAPEVAIGLEASKASDVWALGCCILKLRSGVGPFSAYEVTSPADLMRLVIQTLGDVPESWGNTLFDYDGQPTKDELKGRPLEKYEGERPLKDLVYNIWDQPEGGSATTGKVREKQEISWPPAHEPYHECFTGFFWKPQAVKIDNVYIHGYRDETDELLEAFPKIPEDEAELLYDLVSKIFVYDPLKRITAKEMLDHPWFHISRIADDEKGILKSPGSPLIDARPARRRKLGKEV